MVASGSSVSVQDTSSRGVVLRDFTGGLNNVSDLSAIADNELAVAENFEVDATGALTSRPPFVRFANTKTITGTDLTTQQQMEFLGYYNRADGTTYLVLADTTGTYLFDPTPKTYTLVTTVVASGIAQYQNRLYLCSRTIAGGWYGETVAGSGTYTYQSLSGGTTPMPKGDQIVLYKDRLWIAGWGNSDERTKVYLSDVTTTAGGDINNWPVTNFFYVSRGDGQWITKLYAGPNDLTVYRNSSAYYFRYDSDPRLGILTRYEGSIGCDTKYSLATYQNFVYVVSNGALYQLVGYQFYRRNDPAKVEFRGQTVAAPLSISVALSVVGSRALVWFQGVIYVYNLTTNVWSTWKSNLMPAIMRTIQRPEGFYGPETAYGITGSGLNQKFGVLQFVDDYTFSNAEPITCTIRTKGYDYGMPDRFKTLFWWTADVLMSGSGTGNMIPITLTASAITWDDMSLKTWDELSTGTWDHPTIKIPGVVTTQTNPSSSPERVSLKFRKKLRFRRGYYEVTLTTDGTLATGPAHIFSLTTYVETRQKIANGVT
jgi:hypothetical protein